MDPISAAAVSLIVGLVADKGSDGVRQKFNDSKFWNDLTAAVAEHSSVDRNLFQADNLKPVVDSPDFWAHLEVPDEPLPGSLKHKLAELCYGPAVGDPNVMVGAIHESLIRTLFKHSSLVERELLRHQAAHDEAQLGALNYLADTYELVEATSKRVGRVESLLIDEMTTSQRHASDGDPFVVSEVDLTVWDMVSGRIGHVVPDYIPRDIDTELDTRLSDPETRFVVVAGPTKSGKTRALLEGLRRNVGNSVAVKTERFEKNDGVNPCIGLLDQIDHSGGKVLFIDDLFEDLPRMNLHQTIDDAAAVGVLVVATCDEDKLRTANKRSAQIDGFNEKEIGFINSHKVVIASRVSTGEQERFDDTYPGHGDHGEHFAIWFAAIDLMMTEIKNYLQDGSYDQTHTVRQCLLIAASHLSIINGMRIIDHDSLVGHAKKVWDCTPVSGHLCLPTDDVFISELEWATERFAGPYATLKPSKTDKNILQYELADAAQNIIRPDAVNSSRYAKIVDEPAHINEFALAASHTNKPDEEITWWTKAVDSGHVDEAPTAMRSLGLLHVEQGRPDEAITWWTKAVDSGHVDEAPTAMFSLGLLHYEQGRPDEAIDWYTKAVDSGHADQAPRAMVNLGVLHDAQERFDEAIDWWTKAVDSGHADQAPLAMRNLGLLHYAQERFDEAIDWWAKVVDSGHADEAPRAMVNLGVLHDAQERFDEAIDWWTKAVDSGHADQAPLAMRNLGLLHNEQGRPDEAIDWWAKVVDSGHADEAPLAMQEIENLM